MNYCQDCGTKTQPLHTQSMGCGGRGSMKVCLNCDTLWEQVSGGILATPGGEQYARSPWSFTEYRGGLARNIRPYQKTKGDGKWYFWDEMYDTHGPFDTEELVKKEIASRAKMLSVKECCLCRNLKQEDSVCDTCRCCQSCGCIEHCTHELETKLREDRAV